MQGKRLYGFLKIFSFIVLLLMATGIAYACFISIKYWSGIGV
ncbi:MAG TPA: hypothetical protein VF268_16895 [Gammaproteobacteria bacterium]